MSPEAIDAMLAAGCTAEQIASAVKADMAASAARNEEKRAARRQGNRKRQAEWRQREKAKHTESDVTDVTQHNGVTERYAPSPEVSPQTPFPNPIPAIPPSPPKGGSSPTTKPGWGCRLPDDFEPDLDFAVAEGMTRARAIREAARFRDFWRGKAGKDGVKADWPATWRNWVRKEIEQNGPGDGQRQPRAPPGSSRSCHHPSSSRFSHEGHHRRNSGSFAEEQAELDRELARLGLRGADREDA